MKAHYTLLCVLSAWMCWSMPVAADNVIKNPNVLKLFEEAEGDNPLYNVAAMHRLAILFKDGVANRHSPYDGVRRDDVAALYWLTRYDEAKAAQIKELGKKRWDELCKEKRENRSTSGQCAYTDKRDYHVERHKGYLERLQSNISWAQSNLQMANACENQACSEPRYEGQYRIATLESIARAYLRGDGVTPNDTEAVRWFQVAAGVGSIEARYRLGEMYEQGRGVPADNAVALHWFQQAYAEMGKEPQRWKKPDIHDVMRRNDGKPRLEDAEQAVIRVGLRHDHDKGNVTPEKLYERGLQFTYGDGRYVKDEGYQWIKAAAEAGHGQAMLHLYRLHIQSPNSYDPLYNPDLAQQWLDKSMAIGHPDAFYLAYQIEARKPRPQSPQRAVELLGKAAELGHLQAMVGYYRRADRSVPDIDARAREYLKKASDAGDAEAQILQALLIKDSDRDEALKLLRLANQSPNYYTAEGANLEIEKIVDPVGYQRRIAQKEAEEAAKAAAQAAANTPEALFIDHIHRYGPDTTDSSSFHYEVALYCRYGGPNCHALQVRARQFQNQQNSAAERANMQRIWSGYGSGESLEEFGRRSRARSQCLQALTKSVQDQTSGKQSWRYVGECD
ncbi:MAG: tetratricopeptide repeat protein [Alcanivoracaceae bacterium]